MNCVVYLLDEGDVVFLQRRDGVDLLQQRLRTPDDFDTARASPCEAGENLIG